jgi:iron(III) transport system ATP-binding protein|tara:strand:+ start:122 stop:775 length:654 start_codon:yes stop_codon:yes gene_type:complete
MKNILEIRNISHAYNQDIFLIKDFSFLLKKGEIVSILGPSGIGKTTLLRIVAGLEGVMDGEVIISDKVVSRKNFLLPPEKRNLGLVVEDRALFPHLNIEKNVMFGIRHMQERESLAQEYLGLFKVAELSKKYPHEISAGQQQRVALARALITTPDILLLDEPFGALDKNLKDELHYETKKIFKEKDLSVLLVTHDEEEAEYFSERIIEFQEDQIIIK